VNVAICRGIMVANFIISSRLSLHILGSMQPGIPKVLEHKVCHLFISLKRRVEEKAALRYVACIGDWYKPLFQKISTERFAEEIIIVLRSHFGGSANRAFNMCSNC
jgi:hypothetical protein